MKYLIIAEYASDIERKRIDYALDRARIRAENNGKDKDTIIKPKGTALLFTGEEKDLSEFVVDLYSRLPSGNEAVKIFECSEYSSTPTATKSTIRQYTAVPANEVHGILSHILFTMGAKRNPNKKTEWAVHTRKGTVSITVDVREEERTLIEITLQGFGTVVDDFDRKLTKELQYFDHM